MAEVEDDYEEILAEEEAPRTTNSLADNYAYYGWLAVVGSILVYLVWVKVLRPKYESWQERQESQAQAAMHHKDPDIALARMEGLESARRRLQEQYDVSVAHHLEKTKQQEEIKRQEKIDNWEKHKKGLGYHNKTNVVEKTEGVAAAAIPSSSKTKKSLRPDNYNPLTGSEGGSYRPARNTQCGGGG